MELREERRRHTSVSVTRKGLCVHCLSRRRLCDTILEVRENMSWNLKLEVKDRGNARTFSV